MNVKDIMMAHVESCKSDAMLDIVATMMWKHDCGAIPVIDDDEKPVGIITDRDIAIASVVNHKPLWEISIQDTISGRPLYTCNIYDDIRYALEIMEREKVRRLPIVNRTGQLEGILSIDDVVFYAIQNEQDRRISELSYEDAISTLKAVSKHH